MEKKQGFGAKAEAFFAGKGFYIVLFLCVAVIGVSAWTILTSGAGTIVEKEPVNEPVLNEDYEVYTAPTMRPEVGEAEAANHNPEAPSVVDEEPGLAVSSITDDTPVEEQETASWSENEILTDSQVTYAWPITGEVETPYSAASLIYNTTMGDWRTHDGIDLAAELGTHVTAASSGRVDSIYTDDLYGVTVVIDHMGGLKSIYSNLAETPAVNVGDNVITGDVIGAIGNTALAETGTVTHLHFAMSQDGAAIDPHTYLPER